MTDVFDRATEREEQHREDALNAQRARATGNGSNAGKTYMDSARECRVCSDPIPLKRRKAIPGVNTCVDCQTDLERALRATGTY